MERSHDEPDDHEPDDDGTTPSPAERLAALRRILEAKRAQRAPGAVLPFGIPDLDERLSGGLGLGLPHEIAPEAVGDEAAALGFALALVARRLADVAGDALLVLAPGHPVPYGHGLVAHGLDPARLLLVQGGTDAEVYGALEETLRAGTLAAVAGLVDAGLPLRPGRRLQLAAGTAPPLLLILRPAHADLPNGAATRWRIGSAGAVRDRFGCILRPRWRARLDRCRNGRTGDWLLEWDHAAHRFGLSDGLAGRAPAPRRRDHG